MSGVLSHRLLNGRAYIVSPTAGTGGTTGGTTGGSGLPAAGTKVTDFQIKESAGTRSIGVIRIGHVFAQGDCPAGYVPTISRGGLTVDAQWGEVVYWPDGSWLHGIAWVRDQAFAANENRSYDLTVAPGTLGATAPAISSAAKSASLLQAIAGHDFKATFANMQNSTGGNAPTITPHGSGSSTASLNAHAAAPTRVDQFLQGPICDAYTCWGMAKDDATGQEETNLRARWFLYRIKNPDGSTLALEVCPVIANGDFWDRAGKYQLMYDAAFMDGATTIQSYPLTSFFTYPRAPDGVILQGGHITNSWWLMARMATDFNVGRAHWIGAPIPTLHLVVNQAYWISTGLMPPVNLAQTPKSSYFGRTAPKPYVPSSCQDHRYAIDDFGGYMGRGNVPNTCLYAFMRQTPLDVAIARVNWLAGLHVPLHHRSGQMRQRPGDAHPDIADTPHSLIMDPLSPPEYDFTGDGMPTPGHAYFGSQTKTYNAGWTGDWTSNKTDVGFTQHPWGWAYTGSSHGAAFCYYGRLYDGARYYLDAMHDQTMRVIQNFPGPDAQTLVGNGFCRLLHDDFLRSAQYTSVFGKYNIPRVPVWSAMGGWCLPSNTRSHGYTVMQLAHSATFTPADHPAHRYFKKLAEHNSNYLVESFTKSVPLTPSFRDYGLYIDTSDMGELTVWVTAMNVSNNYFAYWMSKLPGFRMLADFEMAGLKRRLDGSGPGFMGSFISRGTIFASPSPPATTQGAFYDETTNPMSPGNQQCDGPDWFFLQSDKQTLNLNWCKWSSAAHIPFNVGDVVMPGPYNMSATNNHVGIPPELQENTPYYVVSATVISTAPSTGVDTAIKISATPGGPPITFNSFTTFPANVYFWGRDLKVFHDAPVGGMWYNCAGDNIPMVSVAALAWGARVDAPLVPATDSQRIRDWLGTRCDYTGPTAYPGWNYVPTRLK